MSHFPNSRDTSARTSHTDWSQSIFFFLALFFAIRVLGPGWRQGFATSLPDDLPLIAQIFQSNVRAIVLFQTIVYIAAGVFFLRTLLTVITHRVVAWIAIATAAIMLSSFRFALWNLEILNTSLVLSTTVFLLTITLRLAHQPNKQLLNLLVLALASLLLIDANTVINAFTRSESVLNVPSKWINTISDGFPLALSSDFSQYDRFGLSLRLPESFANAFLPTTSLNVILLLFLSLAACGILFVAPVRRRISIALAGLTTIAVVRLVSIILANPTDIQRAVASSLLLMALSVISIFAMLIDSSLKQMRITYRAPARLVLPRAMALAIAVCAVLLLIGIVALEFRTQDWDPSFARTIIERVDRFGGTYYDNGIWHHGPIDALLYDIPRFFTSFGTYWFGIALIVLVMSGVVSISVHRVSLYFGAKQTVALALAVGVFLHLSLSSSDYAGVIYSRNITTTLLIATFAVAIAGTHWSTPPTANRLFIGSFIILGLTVQTMVSSVVTALVVGACVYLLHHRNVDLKQPLIWAVGSFSVALFSAPVWYFVRGSLSEYWDNWWVMARHMNTATNRSLSNQLSLGWDKAYEYYVDRPVLIAIVVVFIAFLIRHFASMSKNNRIISIAIVLWFIAAWVEMAISQRYSSHYFIIPTIPTMIMLAFVLARLFPLSSDTQQQRFTDISVVPTFCVTLILIFTQCSDLMWSGIEGLGRFQSFQKHQQFVADNRSGESKTIRGVLDLVSADNDGLLAWTMFPWTYLEHQRVPATRLSWKSFMLGEIYLASSSPKYVLPDTWKWFDADMKQSQPQAYLYPTEIPYATGTPFSQYVDENFSLAMSTEKHQLSLNRTLWASISTPLPTSPETDSSIEISQSQSMILSGHCQRLDATVTSTPDSPSTVVDFNFQQDSPQAPQTTIRIEGQTVSSLANGYLQYSHQIPALSSREFQFSLLVGPRSAALMVDGRIVSAVRLKRPSGVSMSSATGPISLAQVRTAATPYLHRCG